MLASVVATAGSLSTISATAAHAACTVDVSGLNDCVVFVEDTVTNDPDNTGDADTPDATNPASAAYSPPAATVAAKTLAAEQIGSYLMAQIGAELSGQQLDPLAATCDRYPDGRCPSTYHHLATSSLQQQTTSYTCAPTSARSVLAYRGVLKTESYLAGQMGTTAERGTFYKDLERVLNREQNFDVFVGEPEYGDLTPSELIGRVAFDIDREVEHPAILNVNQYAFTYWGNKTHKPGKHYVTAYGYDTANGGRILVGDVAGSHFGARLVSLAETHTAVVQNKGLVVF